MMIASINTPAMLLAMAIGFVMLFPESGDSGVAAGEAVAVLIMMLETVMVVEGMVVEGMVVEGMGIGELDGSGTTLTQLEGKLQP